MYIYQVNPDSGFQSPVNPMPLPPTTGLTNDL